MSRYLALIFVRQKKYKSGTVSIQIIDKSGGSYRVAKTVGSSSDPDEISYLLKKGYAIIPSWIGQTSIDFRTAKNVIENYNQLWHIEKAFRISKTDLKILPIYHRNANRIQAHICISFAAYTIYKEIERRLAVKNIAMSPTRVAELTKTMYTLKIQIPETDQWETIPFEWTDEQNLVAKIL